MVGLFAAVLEGFFLAAMYGFPRTGQEPARYRLVVIPGPPSKNIATREKTNVLEIILNNELTVSLLWQDTS